MEAGEGAAYYVAEEEPTCRLRYIKVGRLEYWMSEIIEVAEKPLF